MRWGAAVVAIAVLLLAGCGDSNDGKTASTATTTQPATKQPVPAILGTVESGAEDTIDFANAGNRAKVVTTAHKLRRAAEGKAAATLKQDGVPADSIATLKERARLVDDSAARAGFLRVSLAANQVSALMPDLYAHYSDRIPPDVLQLDYLDREAELRSRAGDEQTVRTAVTQLAAVWAELRSDVVAAGGTSSAADFSRHVRAMQRLARGSDDAALQKEARNGLELVDVLEGVFRKQ